MLRVIFSFLLQPVNSSSRVTARGVVTGGSLGGGVGGAVGDQGDTSGTRVEVSRVGEKCLSASLCCTTLHSFFIKYIIPFYHI